jgi:hypothetical protein
MSYTFSSLSFSLGYIRSYFPFLIIPEKKREKNSLVKRLDIMEMFDCIHERPSQVGGD